MSLWATCCQCVISLSVKPVFSLNGNSYLNLWPLLRVLSLCTSVKNLVQSCSYQVLRHTDKVPLSLLFSSLNNLISLRHSSDISILQSSSWPYAGTAPICPSLCFTGEHKTGHSTQGMYLQWKHHPLCLLARLCLVHAGRLLFFVARVHC